MIAILKMKAWGDFDEPYDINVAAGDAQSVSEICTTLNNYCSMLPGCGQDIRLSKYLEDDDYAERLVNMLTVFSRFSENQAIDFVAELNRLCNGINVCVYKDTFSVDNIIQI